MSQPSFATAIVCMDGRIQAPVRGWIRDRYKVAFVDTITRAGADAVVAGGPFGEIESVRTMVRISVERHSSKLVVIAAHEDCAGAPGDRGEHLKHLAEAVRRVRSWGLGAEVVAIWMERLENRDDRWEVELVEGL